ncbi:MAG: PD-(D/E)XK nuclease family transposase [Clostridia bacterium]|nr:PD-(D/E)XK nuclease family transposase [Clostridia bacterium]
MQMDTSLAGYLRAGEGQDPCDALAKEILSNREILAWILKGVVEEFKDCTIRDIADKYIESDLEIAATAVDADMNHRPRTDSITGMNTEDKTVGEGTIYYDIRFSALAPGDGRQIKLIINVEAQNAYRPGYPLVKRALYYAARMISAQNGTEFAAPHYENLKKVYSIWICSQPPQVRQQAITRYTVREETVLGHSTEKKENYDLLSVIFINLSNRFDEHSGNMIDLLNTALTGELSANQKIKVLHEDYGIHMTKKLEGDVSLMCNISEGYRIRGMELGRAEGFRQGMEQGMEQGIQQGMEQGIQQGMEQGMEQGIQQGMQKGLNEGILKGMLSAIRNIMESLNIPADQAMNLLKIPENDRPRYLKLLEETPA